MYDTSICFEYALSVDFVAYTSKAKTGFWIFTNGNAYTLWYHFQKEPETSKNADKKCIQKAAINQKTAFE